MSSCLKYWICLKCHAQNFYVYFWKFPENAAWSSEARLIADSPSPSVLGKLALVRWIGARFYECHHWSPIHPGCLASVTSPLLATTLWRCTKCTKCTRCTRLAQKPVHRRMVQSLQLVVAGGRKGTASRPCPCYCPELFAEDVLCTFEQSFEYFPFFLLPGTEQRLNTFSFTSFAPASAYKQNYEQVYIEQYTVSSPKLCKDSAQKRSPRQYRMIQIGEHLSHMPKSECFMLKTFPRIYLAKAPPKSAPLLGARANVRALSWSHLKLNITSQ